MNLEIQCWNLGEGAKVENLGRKQDVAAYVRFEGSGLGGTWNEKEIKPLITIKGDENEKRAPKM